MEPMFSYDFTIVKAQEIKDTKLQIEMLNEKIISIIEEFGFEVLGGAFGIQEPEEDNETEQSS